MWRRPPVPVRMAAARSQQHQQDLAVQAGLVSSLTSLFSQKLNSTEELKKVPVVKPTPIRWRPQPPVSHLGYTEVGKPALIQLVQSPSSAQQQQQQQQQHMQNAYVTKKTKYSSRSDADRTGQGNAGADKYRLEEWTVYETLPADLARSASSKTAADEEAERRRLKAEFEEKRRIQRAQREQQRVASVATPEMFTRENWTVYETLPADLTRSASSKTAADEEAERRRMKAEFEEKRRIQRAQREQQRVASVATPEMFTREDWTVYETVPSQRVQVTRSASSGAQRPTAHFQQQQQQQQQQLHRSESTDSVLGYRRYLNESNSGSETARQSTSTKTARTGRTVTRTAYNGSVGGGRARRAAGTPEVFTAEEWTVYETLPAETSVQERPQQQRQSKRSVRWTANEARTAESRVKTPDIHSKEEWTVYETIPIVQEAGQYHQHQQNQRRQHQQLYRSPSQESVMGYRRYLDDNQQRSKAVTSVEHSSSGSSRRVYQSGGESRKPQQLWAPSVRQSSSKVAERSQVRSGEGRVGTPVRTEEWTVVRRVPADSVDRMSGVDQSWRVSAGSPAGYRRYLATESSTSLADFDQRGVPDSRLDIPDYYFYSYENGNKLKKLRQLCSPDSDRQRLQGSQLFEQSDEATRL